MSVQCFEVAWLRLNSWKVIDNLKIIKFFILIYAVVRSYYLFLGYGGLMTNWYLNNNNYKAQVIVSDIKATDGLTLYSPKYINMGSSIHGPFSQNH